MQRILSLLIIAIILFGCAEESKEIIGSDSSKAISFNDSEIRFYEKIYHKTFGNCNNDEDCAEIKIEYPEIISNGTAFDSVNSYVQNKILSLPFNEDKYKSMEEISDSLFASYIDVQKEFNDYHTAWFIKTNIKISGIAKNVLLLKSVETIYTGGANSFYDVSFANINLSNGKHLSVNDIIPIEKLSKLESIGKTIFYEMKNIEANKTEEAAGYWFKNKKFELNNNFAITDSGLVFFYNLYEIGPRSNGTTELFIPKEKLVDLTKIYN